MQLRPYQEKLIEDTRAALSEHQSVLLQAPTGAGKTAITVYMMQRAAERGKRSMFIVHQNELLRQTSKALWAQKLEHGMIASGKRLSKLCAQVASAQTLVKRLDAYDPPDLIIIDEAHRSAASTYQKIIDAYPDARVIGLTATPARTDGKGLSDTYGALVQGPSIAQLMRAGYLCDYELFAPPSAIDMTGVKTSMGDYDKAQTEAIIDKPTITGDAVAHYKQHAMGKRMVVMCVSIKHGKHVAEQYAQAGVPSGMIEGSMTDAEREKMLLDFAAGRILVLVNVQLMIEGVDIPAIEAIQWLRPTKSLIIWMQGNGRGLRPHDGKGKLLIFDHVGNCLMHGLPDEDREWSLEGRKRGKRKPKEDDEDDPALTIQQCKKCYHIFRAGPAACPSCGAPVERKAIREIEQQAGELEKIDLDRIRVERKREVRSARDLRDLIALGMRRGFNRPAEWAAHTVAARKGGKASRDEINAAREIWRELMRGTPAATETNEAII